MYQTDRLYLYPMSKHFEKQLIELHQCPDVMKYIGKPYTTEKSKEKIKESEAHWLKHGLGLWCWVLKETGDFVGRGGLRHQILDHGQEIVELAYMINKKFWGRGYATEASMLCINIGFQYLNLSEIYALTTPENIPSQKVMLKIGFKVQPGMTSFRGEKHIISKLS